MKLNRKWILVLSLVLSVAMATVGTLAYMTDTTDTVTNTFTLGNVSIELTEPAWKYETAPVLYPGVSVEKDPTITNTGVTPAWVWMTLEMPTVLYEVIDLEGMGSDWAADEALNVVKDGKTTVTLKYGKVLPAGADSKTTAFTKVSLPKDIEDADYNALVDYAEKSGDIAITIKGYAIQDQPFETIDEAYDAFYAPVTVEVSDAESLTAALEDGNSVIVFNEDVSAGSKIPSNARVKMDLGGNTLTGENSIEGNAVIENGTLDNTTTGYTTQTAYGATTTYNDVDVVSSGGGVSVWGTAVFNGGSVTTNSLSTSSRHVFYVAAGVENGVEIAKGHLTINGGEFTFSPSNLTRKGSYICAQGADAVVIVNGGTFHKPSTRTAPIQAIDGATVTIYGGTFQFDPSAFVAEGYQAVENNGWWTVSAK